MQVLDNFTRSHELSFARRTFLRKTYTHLMFAIFAFIGLEKVFMDMGLHIKALGILQNVSWLLVLGAFMLVSWLATRMAHNIESLLGQYAGLTIYVVAYALLSLPMIGMAFLKGQGAVVSQAAYITMGAFISLTAVVFISKKDFSFMRTFLRWIGVFAILLIVAAIIFKFSLGTWFSIAMIIFASGAILHDTSMVIREFPEDRHVGASMVLLSSVILLFWYVLRLFMSRD